MFGVDLKNSVQACREAQDGLGVFGGVLSERKRVSHPASSSEHRREPEGQACGRFFFGSVSFVRRKEMNSPMKGEISSCTLAKE